MHATKTERTQRSTNTVDPKPGSESVRVSDEKTSKRKTFAEMKVSSDHLIEALYLWFKCLW